MQLILNHSKDILTAKRERDKRRGIRPRPMRAMIVGIPNVGKSTLINRFAKRKATITGDRPGVTKAAHWIKISQDFELLDTPGVLWPKFDNDFIAKRLAVTGAIKDEILPKEDIALFAVSYLVENCPEKLINRYGIEVDNDPWVVYKRIGESRKMLMAKGEIDMVRTMDMVIKEIRDNLLGEITWERVDDSRE